MNPSFATASPADLIDSARAQQPTPRVTTNAAEARQAAEEFEAFFLSQMLGQMFAGIEVNELFGGGAGEKVYRAFMIDEYGRVLSRAGGIGIADAVQKEILKLQEVDR